MNQAEGWAPYPGAATPFREVAKGAMLTDSAFWRDMEAQFRALLEIPDSARLTATYGGRWTVHDGPRDHIERGRLQQLFCSLARRAAIAAGVPDRANALEGWLNLLRKESPHFHVIHGTHKENGVDVPDEGGYIQDVARASADYCVERETRAFELEAVTAALPPLPDYTERRLNLAFEHARIQLGLDGAHLRWHENERERQMRIAAQSPAPTRPWVMKESTIGLEPSVKLALQHFEAHATAYWDLNIARDSRYEEFREWLPQIRDGVLAQVAQLWCAHGDAHKIWYERACAPELRARIDTQIANWEAKARERELRKLEAKEYYEKSPFMQLARSLAAKTSRGLAASEQNPDGDVRRDLGVDGRKSGGTNGNEPNSRAAVDNGSGENSMPPFPRRARWLKERLRERSWNKHDLSRHGGPDHKTVQKVLDGRPIREDGLEKVAIGLSKAPLSMKLPVVTLLDIPQN